MPVDPQAQPTREAAERAIQLFKSYAPEADEVTSEFKQHTTFFHPGANWSGVHCPVCEADIGTWWEGAIRQAAKKSFSDLTV